MCFSPPLVTYGQHIDDDRTKVDYVPVKTKI